MAILIDGLNLIYKIPDLEGLMYEDRVTDAEKGLLEILKEYNTIKKEKIIVFFDGKKQPSDKTVSEKKGAIDIYYSHDYSADHMIKEYIKKNINPRMLTVITSDNGIISDARRFRAKTLSSEKFADVLKMTFTGVKTGKGEEKNPNPVLSEDEIFYWENMFRKK